MTCRVGGRLRLRRGVAGLLLGVDDLIRAMSDKGIEDGSLLHIGETGQVEIGPGWRDLEASWYIGIAAIAASGTGVIVDEVFLGGKQSQLVVEGFFHFKRVWR